MKKITNLSLTLMAIALAFASCNNSDDINSESQDKGDPAVMTINFNNPPSRAVGTPTGESDITEGTVMVFRSGSGILDGMATFTSTATAVKVKITAGTRDVYVVANTGIDFSSVQNVNDLKDFTAKYQLLAINATGEKLPMSGTALTQDATAATVASPASASVTLQFMCSRVTIDWNLDSLNTSMATFEVTGAYLLNVPSSTDCFAFGTDILTSYADTLLTGLTDPDSFSSGDYYPPVPYANVYTATLALTAAAANADNNYFYIFENNLSTSPTIVAIRGTVDNNGTPTTYYYPIVINGSQNLNNNNNTATIVRGQIYHVTATIKGFGNTNPYEPITNAVMNVTIIPASWNPVINIDQTFN